jgi:hypothetical protein
MFVVLLKADVRFACEFRGIAAKWRRRIQRILNKGEWHERNDD